MTFNYRQQPAIYILHDNPEWLPAISAALDQLGTPYRSIEFAQADFALDDLPPEGIFWSKLSASSYSRGRTWAKEYARAVISWLDHHQRRVINGRRAIELEVSKVAQYLALSSHGFKLPHSIVTFATSDKAALAQQLTPPFIVKDNQGGKGLSVQRFDSHAEYRAFLQQQPNHQPTDGIVLLQEYIQSKQPFITRLEFIGGKFHYAVKVDISAGNFELCPAQACQVEPQANNIASCALSANNANLFSLRQDIAPDDELVQRLEIFLQQHEIDIAGIEFFDSAAGERIIYDLNTSTNYNPQVEQQTAAATTALARFLTRQLKQAYPST